MGERSSVATLDTFYKGWENYQNQLIKALEPLTPEQLQLSASQDLRPVWEIVAHIIGARARWLCGYEVEGSEAIKPMGRWDARDASPRTAQEYVEGLRATWAVIHGALDRWTAEDMGHLYSGAEEDMDEDFPRAWIIWHLIEHDLHHGGEFSYSIGMHGVKGVDL